MTKAWACTGKPPGYSHMQQSTIAENRSALRFFSTLNILMEAASAVALSVVPEETGPKADRMCCRQNETAPCQRAVQVAFQGTDIADRKTLNNIDGHSRHETAALLHRICFPNSERRLGRKRKVSALCMLHALR